MWRDGVLMQDVRIVLRTDDGHDGLMYYRGMSHGPEEVMKRVDAGEDPEPSEYYFHTAPVFEAPPGEYDWLNKLVVFAVGRRRVTGVNTSSPREHRRSRRICSRLRRVCAGGRPRRSEGVGAGSDRIPRLLLSPLKGF